MSSSLNTGEMFTHSFSQANRSVKQHVRRYVQSRTIPNPPNTVRLADYDGIAKVWFDDMNGFHGVFSSQDYRDVIKVDEEKFTDPKRVEFLFSEETEILADHEI